ncbi:transglycosylase SLT domain-containing protein [Streptacidiphilus sp. MAP5-3]|uniref:lytic transglycosylase domain-containing protein n=2 Tax=Streptacidiphilus TaxID=228398 RepID=UPI0035120049
MPSHARFSHARRSLVQLNQRVSAMSLNKRLTAGVGAAVLLTGAATGTAVALTGSSSPSHTAAAAGAVAAARPSASTANRSEQRAPLVNASASADAAKAKAAAAAKAKAAADAAAKAKAQAEAQAQAQAQAAAKAKADAAAKAQAQAQAQAAAQAQAQAQAAAAAKAKAAAAAAAAAAATPVYANNLSGWIAQAQAILQADGDQVPTADAITARAMTESSGNPNAQNNWDSNAAAGTPSMGLMQTIQSTFDTYALPGHTDIWNPVDNIVAAVRYANATYGSFMNVAYGSSGY